MIYFDNAATSRPKPEAVKRAVIEAMDAFGNPARGAHAFSLAAARRVEEARRDIAALFGFPAPERVAFTKNVTEALNLAIGSVDGHIVATEAEHNSVLRPLHRRGDFSIAPVDADGAYRAGAVTALCRPDTAAVVVAHASNLTGNIAPVAELGRFCRERGILLIVDAAQSAGLVDIDTERMNVDALCFTGHKSLYGPQGTGGICVGRRFPARPLIVGGSGGHTFDPDQPAALPDLLEAGTANAHGVAGLAAGVRHVIEQGPERLWRRADALARRFVDGLRALDGVVLYGDHRAERRLPIVALNLGAMDSAEAAAALADDFGIAVRAGGHCAPLLHRRFGTERQGALRFSFSPANTEQEIDAALSALAHINRRRRNPEEPDAR